jgi:hypothetical protein
MDGNAGDDECLASPLAACHIDRWPRRHTGSSSGKSDIGCQATGSGDTGMPESVRSRVCAWRIPQSGPMGCQGCKQPSIRGLDSLNPAEDDDVQRSESLTMDTKTLPYQTLKTIAVDCATSAFPGDRKAQTSAPKIIGARQNRETGICGFYRKRKHPTIFRRAIETGRPWKTSPAASLEKAVCDQGVSRLRPLARRALRTLRPFKVADLARNPWVRARFKRLG